MKSNITTAKKQFNRFFQDDLYGNFDSPDNLILSRGSWNDDTLALPDLFQFTTSYTLKKHWVGYSDSLGHENVYRSLVKRFSCDLPTKSYANENFALTMGNVATTGFVYKQLTKFVQTNKKVLATAPYYPSILKTVSSFYENIELVNSLQSEIVIEQSILQLIKDDSDIGIIHLTNFIGVEGRIYSPAFWKSIVSSANERGIYVVIDEGLWFGKLGYPDEITLPNVIRLVSPSKKYGIPGMKLGFLIAHSTFIAAYYEEASSGYGGPASMFFLLLEILMLFEYVHLTSDKASFSQVTESYPDISLVKLEQLYANYSDCIEKNYNLYSKNKKTVKKWCRSSSFIKEAHLYDGLNYFIKFSFNENQSMYEFFLELLESHKVSVMPSSCFGDPSDQYIRLSILEDPEILTDGLTKIEDFIKLRQPKDSIV